MFKSLQYYEVCFRLNRAINKNNICRSIDRVFSSKQKIKWEKRIMSGIQPTGSLHVGNYFGAVKNWVKLQNEGNDVIFSIVDLHSITLPQDPKELQTKILLMAASLIACGIDPSKSILFQQSKVHQHTELMWVLTCITTMARLGHLPQFKEKSSAMKEVPLGLYTYPVLQAADILLYRATDVPVGDDQLQHLQLTALVAKTFNHRFGETFPIPKPIVEDSASSRVRSLREPTRKMSKSHADPKSRIILTDPPDVIVEKVKKAVTDFTSAVTYDEENRPGVSNLIALHAYSTSKTFDEVCSENKHLDTGKYKYVVAEALVEFLRPIREEIDKLMCAPDYLEEVLDQGSQRATVLAEITWLDVRQKVGLETLPLPKRENLPSVCSKQI